MTRAAAALLALLALAGCGDGDGPTGTRPPAPGPRGPAARKDVATFSQIMFVYRGANGQTFKRTRPEALALAQDMLRRLAAGEPMAVLIRNYTDDLGVDGKPFNSGSYTIARTQAQVMASVREAVFALQPGELRTEPLDTGMAFLVIRRDE
ncbi:MAG: peptidylprolyl isomerase [Planctomycetota bacterium]